MKTARLKTAAIITSMAMLLQLMPTTALGAADELAPDAPAAMADVDAGVVDGDAAAQGDGDVPTDATGGADEGADDGSSWHADEGGAVIAPPMGEQDAGEPTDVADEPPALVPASPDDVPAEPALLVEAHVKNEGWLSGVGSGQVSGTTGRGLRVEALRVTPSGPGLASESLRCRAYVQNEGWKDWVGGGELCGTTGRGHAIEALRIRLEGEADGLYDIWYQVHVKSVGWMEPTCNGGSAGTTGQSLRVEAVRIWLVGKGSGRPADAFAGVPYACIAADGLMISAHVQNIGWMAAVGEGRPAGTTGRGLRVEAFSISRSNLDEGIAGNVEYRAHVQNEGWQDWRANGAIAGTTGMGRRVEAVQMRLTGSLGDAYDIWYRAHVQGVGWLAWARGDVGGVTAGSEGMSLRVEALEVRLIARVTGEAPQDTDASFEHPAISPSSVAYTTHTKGLGWLPDQVDGGVAGRPGEGLRVEALRASVTGGESSLPGGITYRAHVQNKGWLDWVAGGVDAGTTGERLRVEAFEMRLTGRLAGVRSVWYRAYVQDAGWLGWAHDGETAGSTGAGRYVEAIQVRLVRSGGAAPGGTANHCVNADYFRDDMSRRAQGYSSPTGQLVLVDLAAHRVGIYVGSAGSWSRTHLFPCSVGAPGTSTVRGVFSVGSRGYVFGNGFSCYYWTQFHGAYLFHSVLYYPGTFNVMDGRLGLDISHGCVRMAIDDARYINENIRSGTTVVSY